MENLRRLLFAIFVFVLAALLFSWWRQGSEGYGLMNLLRGEKPGPAALTPPDKPKLALDELPLMSRLNDEFAKLSAAVLPSVVSVTTKTVRPGQMSWHPFYGLVGERAQIVPGLGSGVIVSKEGHVVTNYHVIEGVAEVQITTNDNKKYPVLILGASKDRDIALLKIDSNRTDFPALGFANSDEARVGQIVFAVGNPFGLSGTVTQGIISARDRHLSDSQFDYLQTDTVINPGNSGGPLVNIRGEIIGINVAIYRGDDTVRAWQGVGLAVPANDAKMVVDGIQAKIREGAKNAATVSSTTGKGYLGLEVSSEPVEIDPVWGTSRRGALVTDISPRSPAAEAGLRPGDVVTKFQGMAFRSPGDLLQIIRTQPPGSEVKLEVIRSNKMGDIIARLGTRPDAAP
ncbi:trypsin-like peptidase domain-containing protein [Prosthecobacter sp.]|uniref:S1C family serine protease n=1 Tax=Prosthecobacter sp. TaxID=1965333 RepID=UPI002AB9315E|nr:trypsin-like peptidase domain-containing protein [Prosthecobacter sp.]MDZ4405014.1 trypsin-like peptidase domain-containing protein [Prosthecobacter sp.]